MKKTSSIKKSTQQKWEAAWQKHWKSAQLNYELPSAENNPELEEHKFLNQHRSKEKEALRLKRIEVRDVQALFLEPETGLADRYQSLCCQVLSLPVA